jgi:hypothetical protein
VFVTAAVNYTPGMSSWNGIEWNCRWIDEGHGKCQMIADNYIAKGIYKREAGKLIICLPSGGNRPTEFRATDANYLLFLHPAKPLKK